MKKKKVYIDPVRGNVWQTSLQFLKKLSDEDFRKADFDIHFAKEQGID